MGYTSFLYCLIIHVMVVELYLKKWVYIIFVCHWMSTDMHCPWLEGLCVERLTALLCQWSINDLAICHQHLSIAPFLSVTVIMLFVSSILKEFVCESEKRDRLICLGMIFWLLSAVCPWPCFCFAIIWSFLIINRYGAIFRSGTVLFCLMHCRELAPGMILCAITPFLYRTEWPRSLQIVICK